MRRFQERPGDGSKAVRVGAALAAGALISLAAAWLAGVDDREQQRAPQPTVARPSDPLQAELLRCNGLGQGALEDPACRATWAENRRRFFGEGLR